MKPLGPVALFVAVVAAHCEPSPQPPDPQADAASTDDTGPDSGVDAGPDTDGPAKNRLTGTVMAPSGTFPIAGALVYLTRADGAQIPDEAFCFDCEDLTGIDWTLSRADGTWTLTDLAPGDWNLVTRKGLFQRQRPVHVYETGDQEVPVTDTTLPAQRSADGRDQIPNFAVALNDWDRAHELLAKLGLAELDAEGKLVFGTEEFDIYNDDHYPDQAGYPASSELFKSIDTLKKYHMVFMPCTSETLKHNETPPGLKTHDTKELIRQYVATGGRFYATCMAYDWIEQPFPDYIEFPGDDDIMGDASHKPWSGPIAVKDDGERWGLRSWLQVVTDQNPDSFFVSGAWVHAQRTFDVDDGMGLDEDLGVVKPVTWSVAHAWEDCGSGGCPMNVTYSYGCGKVFFSAFQVVEEASTDFILPQEYILLYLIFEVGVCQGLPIVE